MKSVLLLLADGFEPMEMAALTDVMAWVNFIKPETIKLTSASFQSTLKTAFGGLTVSAERQVSHLNLADYDALAIPGGMESAGFFNATYSDDFAKVIRYFNEKSKPIASVCVASLCLGYAGVLTDRKASVYHSTTGVRKAELESQGAVFIDNPIVCDGHIITSTGPGTAIEVALTLLAMLTDNETALATREMMRVPMPDQQWYQQPQVS